MNYNTVWGMSFTTTITLVITYTIHSFHPFHSKTPLTLHSTFYIIKTTLFFSWPLILRISQQKWLNINIYLEIKKKYWMQIHVWRSWYTGNFEQCCQAILPSDVARALSHWEWGNISIWILQNKICQWFSMGKVPKQHHLAKLAGNIALKGVLCIITLRWQ